MKTLAILYPGCIEFEIMLACELLNKHYPVEVVTPDGADHIGSNGMLIQASKAFDSVDPSAYKVVLVPGGDPGILIGHQKLPKVLRACYSNGAILGAICAGPIVLEQAGLLKNQKVAHGYKGAQLEYILKNGFFKESELTNEPIIIGDRIMTARADSFIDFAVEIAHMAGCVQAEAVPSLKDYYKGRP